MGAPTTDRLLGLFGGVAAIAATFAFATDGWSTSEFVSAAIIWVFAIGAVAYIFREDIQDIWYGVAGDDVSPAKVSDAEAIHSLAESHFGNGVTPIPQIKSLVYRHKKMFWVLANKNRNKTVTSVDGYVCIFPLSAVHVSDIENLRFSVSDLTVPNLPKKNSDVHAVYIGGVVGQSYRARAKLLMFVEQKSREAAIRSKTRTIYAKAATRHGFRTLKKKEFSPVRQDIEGLQCFYKKVLE